MKRNDILKQILSPEKRPAPLTKVNYKAKAFINRLLGKKVFDLEGVKPDPVKLYDDYLTVFNLDSEKARRVLYDLAEHSGFFRANAANDPVQEGKRCMFIYLLGKITKEPQIQKEKE